MQQELTDHGAQLPKNKRKTTIMALMCRAVKLASCRWQLRWRI